MKDGWSIYRIAKHLGRPYNTIKNEILTAGKTAALNVDRRNPVTNHLYRALGFEPVQVAQYSEDTKIGRVIGYQSDSPGDALAYGAVVGILVSAESSGEDGE